MRSGFLPRIASPSGDAEGEQSVSSGLERSDDRRRDDGRRDDRNRDDRGGQASRVDGGRRDVRLNRRHEARVSSHRASHSGTFGGSFIALGNVAYAGARVSANVVDLDSGATLVAIDDRIVQPVGGVGRLLLLIEISAQLSEGKSGYTLLDKSGLLLTDGGAGFGGGATGQGTGDDLDHDHDTDIDTESANAAGGAPGGAAYGHGISSRNWPSDTEPADGGHPGLWKRLKVPALPVLDLAVLIGATGDPLAMNAVISHTSQTQIRNRAESIGLDRFAILDLVRTKRGPDDAPHFAVASAEELAGLLRALRRGEIIDPPTSARVLDWLGGGTGSSLVAAALGPESPGTDVDDFGLRMVSVTGIEFGLRAEAGVFSGPRGCVAFAVIIEFDGDSVAALLAVMEALRAFGLDLLEQVG